MCIWPCEFQSVIYFDICTCNTDLVCGCSGSAECKCRAFLIGPTDERMELGISVQCMPSPSPTHPCTPASPTTETEPSVNFQHMPSPSPTHPAPPVNVECAPSPTPSHHHTPTSLTTETILASTATDNGSVQKPMPSPLPRQDFSSLLRISPPVDEPDEELPIP